MIESLDGQILVVPYLWILDSGFWIRESGALLHRNCTLLALQWWSGPRVKIDRGVVMTENVYKVIELVGTSSESWEKATAAAINRANKTLRDLRVAEVVKLDVQIKNGKVEAYRSRISVSFKYESGK